MDFNQVTVSGRIVAKPEFRQSAKADFCTFALAINGATADKTTFVNCVAFDKVAKFASKYLPKGTHIMMSASLITGSVVTKTGVTIPTTKLLVKQAIIIDSKQHQKRLLEKDEQEMRANDKHKALEVTDSLVYDASADPDLPVDLIR